MPKLKGVVPAILTPLTKEEEINEPVTRQLVNHLIESGVHGIFCLGTNGEFATLSEEEKIKVAQIVIEETNGRVPVIVGTGGNSTKEVIAFSKKIEETGANMLSIITPYFDPPSQTELIKHYEKIAAATSLPIILYNMPSRTGVSLAPETVSVLSRIPHIEGIKDSSGNFDLILQYIEQTDDDFSVLSGNDSLILWTLMAGGEGGVAATANMFPELVLSIYDNWKKGNLEEAKLSQNKLRAIRNASKMGTTPSVFKKAVELLGIPVGPPRSPVMELSEEATNRLRDVLQLYKK
ncbi:4-hydroxy-tetrahydrodipicolinate synthase [Scopulibacillus darangshiensis]|uniref:4-hydroxy-tetrahydrodipicolinate synthase n=1 Tax=Scopulibacillus darangshiensis TaxID=442528 RepID=A0A4R2NQM6_9BACL|nr:4-hydroxy-tetrahydrodipicolinate synthase [Scopulibacillus darangshiensis]TCP23761.1 4-hydroxy-tetrahydrodipicolinate synthase [Scopulibacillus darangshiensis]